MPTVTALDHLVLTVADLEASCAFYAKLGMRHEVFQPADGTTRHALAFGRQKINLHLAGAEFDPKSAQPMPGSGDLCFLTDAPLAEWIADLEKAGIAIIDGPVARTGAQSATLGPLTSIYVRDPDGNLIEIATYRT